MWSPMRTLGFRTHVLLAIAGAIGVLYSLSRPWYAAAPLPMEEQARIGDIHGPLNAFMDGAQRWVSGAGGLSGWQSLDHWGQMMAAMVVVAVLGALACTTPKLQKTVVAMPLTSVSGPPNLKVSR